MLQFQRAQSRYRLLCLLNLGQSEPSKNSDTAYFHEREYRLEDLRDKLGRAGYLGAKARRNARNTRNLLLCFLPLSFLLIAFIRSGSTPSVLGALILTGTGIYCGLTLWVVVLRYRTVDFEREVLFRLPLFLESLILIVEAGMGVLPALEQVLIRRERLRQRDPVSQIFGLVYSLSSRGLPLEQALELVADHIHIRSLRHVLLHLDISANIGGELIPSLRSLGEHAHNEWRLSVEHRVRRLENLVVFPVFASVMGMIALTAAVPLVPLLGLQETLQHKQELPTQVQGGVQP